ncbi:MAG TPA: methyltransferase domain-containing protein [Blastocatellia bacterium]|nr:methyltransferase domain-containing protein [Blastocatellia bacterium]
MGFYSRHVFPRALDLLLRGEEVGRHRRAALAPLAGRVLEVGFGTGLNLPHYPPAVTGLTVIDPERMLAGRVARRIAAARVPVEAMQLDASGRLPFADGSFDGVATTFTLCTIPDVRAALAEMRRVLKPAGLMAFLEHGRSDDAATARWQDALNSIQKAIACGCHLNRRIDGLITDAGFAIDQLARYQMPGLPRVVGAIYRGTAHKQEE